MSERVEQLRAELRALDRERPRDDAEQGIALTCRTARAEFEREAVAAAGVWNPHEARPFAPMRELALLYLIGHSPEFAARLVKSLQSGSFSKFTRAELDKRRATLEQKIVEAETAEQAAEIKARIEQAQSELAGLGVKPA